MSRVGFRLESRKDISQEEFDNGISKVKEGFKRKGIDFENENIITSSYEEETINGVINVLEFIKVI